MENAVSVVIPLYGYAAIDGVVRALLSGNSDLAEIIVVDNTRDSSKREACRKALSSFPGIVRYLPQASNLGVTGGRNKGFAAISDGSEFVLFLDHDVYLAPGAIDALVREYRRIQEAGPIGILTGKVLFKDNPELVWAAGTEMNLWTGQVHFHSGPDDGRFDQRRKVGVAPSILFTTVSLVRQFGGFDNTFFANYDDTEFSYRFSSHGYPVWYTPKVVGYHDIPSKGGNADRLLDRGYYIARNRVLFMRRYAAFYPFFLAMLPLWWFYYGREYARNGRLGDFFRLYLKGSFAGIFGSGKEQRANSDDL